MKFVRGRDDNGVKPFTLQHGFQAVVRILDLEFGGGLSCASGGNIGDSHQLRLGHQAAKILGVAPPHLSNSQHTNSQFPHRDL